MLPSLLTSIPGPQSRAYAARLKRFECPDTTFVGEEWPVFWQKADGENVWDIDSNRYIDLTAAFGVASLGHGFSKKAMQDQSALLIHGMGDVHPTPLKAQLCEALSAITYQRWGKETAQSLLTNAGFEAVEAALKTAQLATQKTGIISFQGAYHGLGYGALRASGLHFFRQPFLPALPQNTLALPFPEKEEDLHALSKQLHAINPNAFGCLIVEPIQGRNGKRVPPRGFLQLLEKWCNAHDVLFIIDEIFTGFNRTGKLFACEWEGVIPDGICMGKALTGGYPLSAFVAKRSVMEKAWTPSTGEALHTSTFLGNPIGCAMALASLAYHQQPNLAQTVLSQGEKIKKALLSYNVPHAKALRGKGLMLGLPIEHPPSRLLNDLLKQGIIALCDGSPPHSVLSITPPFFLHEASIDYVAQTLARTLSQYSL